MSLTLDFLSLLLVLSLFSFAVVTVYVLFTRSQLRSSGAWLVAFLVFTMMSLGHFLYLVQSASPAPLFAYLPNTVGLAAAPCLFLFARSAVGQTQSTHSAVHLAPVPVFVAIVLFAYTVQPEAERLAILRNPSHPSLLNSAWLPASIFLYVSAYLLATLNLVRIQGRRFREWFSRPGVGDLRWLQISLVGMLAVWVLSVLHEVVTARWPSPAIDRLFLKFLAVCAFAFALNFLAHALRHTQYKPPAGADGDKYGPHRMDDDDIQRIAQRVAEVFESEKPFLEPDLALGDLAELVHVSPRDLSQVLNRHFGKSFFDIVNERRVRHAKALLRGVPEQPITAVMLDSGFTSKSSFYAAFRRVCGQTPSQYRRS